MDKSWMTMDRRSKEYESGVENFLQFGLQHASNPSIIRCPCLKCGNAKAYSVDEIRDHLFFNGIDQSYHTWIWHGESLPIRTQRHYFPQKDGSEENLVEEPIEMVNATHDPYASDPTEFSKLLEDAEKPLFVGCTKYTKLSALVKLYNLKARHSLSDKGFSELLILIGDMLPTNNELPLSMYEAKKSLNALGMEYEKIHACPQDCILYRKEYKDATSCPKCGISRWKMTKNSTECKKGVPAKVLWYFPIIPRFKRMYNSVQTAKNLTWHASDRKVDGHLRHPADSPSWKLIDYTWPDFANESRNLRLAISADGINPHGSLSSRYSCWPVLMVIYNLPPWLCMKRKYMMLTLLISGPSQPGNDIDIYLAPLVDDLKLLWEDGVKIYDAYRQESFTLKAVLLWTINDFPAYGNLSGHKVKGYCACPICSEQTSAQRLKHGKKQSFVGHRRFLPRFHPYRKEKRAFNGEEDFRLAPVPLSGEEILEKVTNINYSWGKDRVNFGESIDAKKTRKKKYGDKKVQSEKSNGSNRSCWKKKSIFFDLEYWKSLHVRHILDVMHIEKNVCESIVGTLLDIPGKTKDGLASRLDLVEMGLRPELAPQVGDKRTYLPPACYTLSKDEKRRFCRTLSEVKVPEGYSSNFKNIVSMQDLKLYSLKSHDCHTLMQQLLPLALRSVLPKPVRYAITRLCFFFNDLCTKVVDVSTIDETQNELVETLCSLEKYFPPSFFDIMIHLTVHLIRELKLCGPVCFRWMYPFERYMKVLKGYVRNPNRPEGCIAECYIAEEAIEFCTEYLSNVNAIGIPVHRNDTISSKPVSSGSVITIDCKQWEQAHRYVLENTSEVQPYIDEHMQFLKEKFPNKTKRQKWLHDEHNRTFIYWLREKVAEKLNGPDPCISENLRWIAHGPRYEVISYPGYVINGYRFHTKERDDVRVQQNSGVSIVARTIQISSAKDNKPVISDMSFYGVIQEIWDLDYNKFKITVFKCDWVESCNGVKKDELGFILVDLNRIGHKTEPFILASQAKQVFYVKDPVDPQWSILLSTSQRDIDGNTNDEELMHAEDQNSSSHDCFPKLLPNIIEDFDMLGELEQTYVRGDCEGTWIEN